jgi:uncharacterized membrane protein YjfL (UPF0719 family)
MFGCLTRASRLIAAGDKIAMPIRTRKLIGTIVLILFLAVYCLIAMVGATSAVINGNTALELAYFIAAGLLWVIPAGLLIKWMQRP